MKASSIGTNLDAVLQLHEMRHTPICKVAALAELRAVAWRAHYRSIGPPREPRIVVARPIVWLDGTGWVRLWL